MTPKRVTLPPLTELEAGLVLNSLSLVAAIVAGDAGVAETIIPHATLMSLELGGTAVADLVSTIAELCAAAFPNRTIATSGTVALPSGPRPYGSLTQSSKNGGMVS